MDYNRTPEQGMKIYLNGCSCGFDSLPVGMTYVPMQPWEEIFELDKGLRAGTIFPSLRLPFIGGGR